MHWYAVWLVYFHWSLLNWRNSVAYSFCWYMIQFNIFYFVFFFNLIIVIYCFDTWNMEYDFCRQVLLTCPYAFVVLKRRIFWFLIPILCIYIHTYIWSSAVIIRSNIVSYYMNNYRNCGRIFIRCWICKRHPITRPNVRAMKCILWIFVRKLAAL